MVQTKKFRRRINRRKTRSKTFNKKKSTIKKTPGKYNKTKKRRGRRAGAPSVCTDTGSTLAGTDGINRTKNCQPNKLPWRNCPCKNLDKSEGIDAKSCHFRPNAEVFLTESTLRARPLWRARMRNFPMGGVREIERLQNQNQNPGERLIFRKQRYRDGLGGVYGPNYGPMNKEYKEYKTLENTQLSPLMIDVYGRNVDTVRKVAPCQGAETDASTPPDGPGVSKECKKARRRVCELTAEVSDKRYAWMQKYMDPECHGCDGSCANHASKINSLNNIRNSSICKAAAAAKAAAASARTPRTSADGWTTV